MNGGLYGVLLAAVLGGLGGLGTAVLAIWLPQRILNQEGEWLARIRNESWQPQYPHRLVQCLMLAMQRRRSLLTMVGLGMVLGVGMVIAQGVSWTTLLWGLWVWALLTAAVIDSRTQFLPDALTLPLLWAGLLLQSFEPLATMGLQRAVWGACVGYLVLWGMERVYVWWRGHSGVGQGDMKLLAAIGAWLGPGAVPHVLLLAALGALVWQGIARARHTLSGTSEFPFGPWIAVGAVGWMGWNLPVQGVSLMVFYTETIRLVT